MEKSEVEREYQPSINKYPIVDNPNCYVAADQGWNTNTHNI